MFAREFAGGIDGPAGAGAQGLPLIDDGPRMLRESEPAHGDTVGGGRHRNTAAQRSLARGNDPDLVEAELLVRGHGRGHMPRMRRIEGPT